jgi:hypothetical protein
MVKSMFSVKAMLLSATNGSDTFSEWYSCTIESNFSPFAIMALSPFVSFSNAGVASGSMLTALSAYNSFCAFSNSPLRHNSASRLAIYFEYTRKSVARER